MEMIAVLVLGLGLLALGVFASRNAPRLAKLVGPWVTPRSEDARDGMIVLVAVFCFILGVMFSIIAVVALINKL